MNGKPILARLKACATIGTVLLMSLVGVRWSHPALASAAVKTSDEAFKNIQVLKGIPANQIFPTMQFISAALGVQCEHCHVEGTFDKDDKKLKQTARKWRWWLRSTRPTSKTGVK